MAISAAPFEGRLVLVTQADRPLGVRLSRRLAEGGADLVLAAERGEAAVAKLRRDLTSLGRTVLLVTGDLSDEEHARGLVDELVRRVGRPTDAMVVVPAPPTFGDPLDPAVLEHTFSRTVFAAFGLLRWLLPTLGPGAGLTLVIEPSPDTEAPGRAAVVGAVAALARSLSVSLSPKGIRINVVAATPRDEQVGHPTTLGLAMTLADPASTATGQMVGAD